MSIVVHKHSLGRDGDSPITTAWTDYIPVLDKGYVRLEAALASDLDPTNSARVSFGTRKTEMDERDEGLVKFLVKHRHGSPTEHSFFRFEVKAPIFVVREWQRHRISSFNEASGRYMELAREWYQPALEDYRVQKGKAGAYYFEQDPDEARVAFADERINTVCNDAFDAYEAMLARGVAKEIARMVLPLNTYTSMWVSVNPRSLMNFLSLRNAPNAQYEIRAYAEVMEEIFKQVMPVTAEAFVQNGRVSP